MTFIVGLCADGETSQGSTTGSGLLGLGKQSASKIRLLRSLPGPGRFLRHPSNGISKYFSAVFCFFVFFHFCVVEIVVKIRARSSNVYPCFLCCAVVSVFCKIVPLLLYLKILSRCLISVWDRLFSLLLTVGVALPAVAVAACTYVVAHVSCIFFSFSEF